MFVYVVTSYVNPSQTERLVARLRRGSPGARIIVSHDRKMPTPDADVLDRLQAELWLTPEPVTWGDSTYLRSLLALIERADLAQDDWLTVLTGQDYPLRRFSSSVSRAPSRVSSTNGAQRSRPGEWNRCR